MRLSTRVTLIALGFCLAFSTGLAAIILVRSFRAELDSELTRGLTTNALLSGTLSASMEAFSSLEDQERLSRAARVAVRYMPGAGLVAVMDHQGSLIHDNLPLEMAPLLSHIPTALNSYAITRYEETPYQFIRRDFEVMGQRFTLFTAWDLSQVYASAAAQARSAGLIIMGMGILLWALLSLVLKATFRPLLLLERAAKRIGAGDYAARAPQGQKTDEVGQLSEAFNHMAQATQEHIGRLKRQDAAQKQFIADMAHELKTPVTSMIGYADLMRRSPMEAQAQHQALTAILTQGERLERMGQKLLQLSGLNSEAPLDLLPLTAQALFTPALETVAALAREKDILFSVSGGSTLLSGDQDLLITLIQNLLTNAIKASHPGGSVFLSAQPGLVTVRDQGVGIAPEHLPHLTEAFYMADKSRTRSEAGNGLGLALANRIAHSHGARLCFESEPGRGTTVRLLFTSPIHP
ncbi:MAG: HAMP domain-containing protein [Clostridiales bacterium]|nr:HAMP domain-containing protein [Clostridiales bacterium]